MEHGADIILPFAEVECKFLKSKVYPSWIRRDYIPRFNNPHIDHVIVTNYKWFIPKDCRALLYENHIRVMDRYEFIWYVINRLRGNKYYSSMSVYTRDLNNLVEYVNGLMFKTLNDYG